MIINNRRVGRFGLITMVIIFIYRGIITGFFERNIEFFTHIVLPFVIAVTFLLFILMTADVFVFRFRIGQPRFTLIKQRNKTSR